jgi:hypothetical protein
MSAVSWIYIDPLAIIGFMIPKVLSPISAIREERLVVFRGFHAKTFKLVHPKALEMGSFGNYYLRGAEL